MSRRLLLIAVLVTACGGPQDRVVDQIENLPETTADRFEQVVQSLDKPAVVNVWASWCLPCRSEAPLLSEAASRFGDRIEFVGIAVQDTQSDAKEFLAEYGLNGFDHYFDGARSVPARLGGFGTPITFFFGPNGDLVRTHNGVIDERTLALNIDELLRLES